MSLHLILELRQRSQEVGLSKLLNMIAILIIWHQMAAHNISGARLRTQSKLSTSVVANTWLAKIKIYVLEEKDHIVVFVGLELQLVILKSLGPLQAQVVIDIQNDYRPTLSKNSVFWDLSQIEPNFWFESSLFKGKNSF